MQLTDKVFVVTGGGNGIGRDVTLELLSYGARVAAVDLRGDSLEETARLAAAGGRLSLHTVDVSDRAAVESLATDVPAQHGQVDGLVNVAGIIQPFVDFADLDHPDIEKVMAVNFWGVVHTSKAFLPALVARPEACIVNVSSMGALVPVPGQSIYGASKAAVKLLTEGLYAELRDTRVQVTTVFPGAIETEIATNSAAELSTAGEDVDFPMTSSPEAARQIVEAIRAGSPRIRIGSDATMLDRLSRLVPVRAVDLVAKKMAAVKGG